MTGRKHCLTQKVHVDGFDPIYVHVDVDKHGKPAGIRFSAPGKYRDQQLGKLFDAFSDHLTSMLGEVK